MSFERLEPTTLYTKYEVYTIRISYFIKLYFHHETYDVLIFIHVRAYMRVIAIMHHM